MINYENTDLDVTSAAAGIILYSEGRFAAGSETCFRHVEAGGDPVSALDRYKPDILVLDAARATPALVAALSQPRHHDLPIIVIAGADESDAAGTLLDHRIVAFLPPWPDIAAIDSAIRDVDGVRGSVRGVADAGASYDPQSRIESLRRDAERMAAAIAELAGGVAGGEAPKRPVTAARIRNHIRARRIRDRFFGADLFADPAWDMLLDLAAARIEGKRVSVSSLCIAAAVPTTTGLRWIKTLIDRGLLVRHSDPSDARRAFITMSADTQSSVDACLEATLNFPGQ